MAVITINFTYLFRSPSKIIILSRNNKYLLTGNIDSWSVCNNSITDFLLVIKYRIMALTLSHNCLQEAVAAATYSVQ